jgi:hypothetical protein
MITKRQLLEMLNGPVSGDLDAPVEICFPCDEPGVHHDYELKEVTVVAGTDPMWTTLIAGDYVSGGGL